jgi:hypothetical protein
MFELRDEEDKKEQAAPSLYTPPQRASPPPTAVLHAQGSKWSTVVQNSADQVLSHLVLRRDIKHTLALHVSINDISTNEFQNSPRL